MELLVATTIGLLTAAGLYLMMRQRTFPVIVGLTLLSYSVNLFIFISGRLTVNMAPIIDKSVKGYDGYTDPLPQALVLTAIVISFGMTAVIVIMALGAYLSEGDDRVDLAADRDGEGGK